MSAKFGPAGNSESFSNIHKSSLAAPKWIAEFGLDCYEYQCGKGVHVGEETCRKLGENARAAGISLSLHAPNFINLANPPGRRGSPCPSTPPTSSTWPTPTRRPSKRPSGTSPPPVRRLPGWGRSGW